MIDATRHDAQPRARHTAWWPKLLLSAAALAAWAPTSRAQLVGEDFVNPILATNSQGHTDLIQVLAFTPDGSRVLTGGRDKVVHIWELDRGRPTLQASIRPPMRRRGGRVYALAVSPQADAAGRRLVAVAGISAIGSRGGILVYRVGPAKGREAADLVLELPSGRTDEPAASRRGHAGSVMGLAFSPDGLRLASCGDESDRTVRIWELGDKPRTVAVLQGHAGAVRKVAFLDDARVVSVGGAGDGSVRLWDCRIAQALGVAVPDPSELALKDGAKAVSINALAISPDGRHVVIGREDGRIEGYDGGNLGGRRLINPDAFPKLLAPPAGAVRPLNLRRSIEALACSPDGKTLAVSVLQKSAVREEVAEKLCDVELRSMPEGRPAGPVKTARGLVMALGFSPDGRFLAMGGGDRQELELRDMAVPARVDLDLQADGPGTMLWDVAFVDASPTLAFRRKREGTPSPWETFDLRERRAAGEADEAGLRRSVQTLDGWRFRSLDLDRVEFVPPEGVPLSITLPATEVRWSSYTFIPADAAAGHPAPCAALGTEDGSILIYNLRDRTRSRVFLGHGGAVHAMAPSADGRWLASCSADMTIALWNLAGCHARPPLGATLGRDPQGRAIVQAVSPRSAALRLGLKPGDLILGARHRSTPGPLDLARLDEAIAAISPDLNDPIAFQIVRPGVVPGPPLSSSRADVPALQLLAAPDREWVVWMPEGFYETSIAGDRRLIGWHVNHIDTTNPNDFRSLPSDFHPMSRFEAQLRRPAVIDALLTTGDPVAALATVQGPPIVQTPPVIRLIAPVPVAPGAEIVAAAADLNLQVEAEASAGRLVSSIVVHHGPRRLAPRVAAPPAATLRVEEPIRLAPDMNVVTIEAVDDRGVRSIQDFSIRLAAAEPPPVVRRDPRLVVRSIGVEDFRRRDTAPIKHARSDAEALAEFFPKPDGRSRFSDGAVDARALIDPDAEQVAAVFRDLADDVRSGRLKAGDTVVISLESHLFQSDGKESLVLAASPPGDASASVGASSGAIAEQLEEAASQGCLVMVLVDALHEDASRRTVAAFRDWVRDLSNRRGVVVMVASKQEPSQRLDAHGAFAEAVLEFATVAGGAAARGDAPITLQDFRSGVVRRVGELTSRRQFADLFPPETLSGWRKIRPFDPQSVPGEDLVRR